MSNAVDGTTDAVYDAWFDTVYAETTAARPH